MQNKSNINILLLTLRTFTTMKTLPKIGDNVICEIDYMLILSQVTEVYENGDICTKYHGIRTKNEYRLKTKKVYLATVHIVPHYRI